MITISEIKISQVNELHDMFTQIMHNDYKLYTNEIKSYFLDELFSKDNFRSYIERSIYKIYVALDQSKIVGFLVGDTIFGGVGFITWLAVDPNYRGKGLAKALVNQFQQFAKQKGAHMIEVYTKLKLQKFYEKLGFEYVGLRKKGFFNIENLIMDKYI